MQATKYKDLVVLLILLDEVEARSRELAERYPELRAMASGVGFRASTQTGLASLPPPKSPARLFFLSLVHPASDNVLSWKLRGAKLCLLTPQQSTAPERL
jgi:hypothetical protein